jgi:hypothetical protein
MLRKNAPEYKKAARVTGVPWTALAALHFRECGMVRTAGNAGGPFMLDFGGSGTIFEDRIARHEVKMCLKYRFKRGTTVSRNFLFACVVAGDELRSKARKTLWKCDGTVNRFALADAYFGYNGRASWYGHWRKSPFVSNHPEAGYKLRLYWVSTKTGKRHSFIDCRPGAIVVWDELKHLEDRWIFPLLS